MQVTNFCSEHGGEEAQSGRFICSLLGVSVETHLSTNLTAVLLFAIDATSAVAQVEDAKRSKTNSGAFKIRRRLFVDAESGALRIAALPRPTSKPRDHISRLSDIALFEEDNYGF
jgi:hypothetical protein